MPGRYMHSTSASACEICAPGTFQGRSGQTHCVACEPGGYCEGGGARKTLCPAGTYNDVRGLSNASQCKSCTPGHSCSIGSVGRTKCRAGYFAATERAADCHECDAGKYQDIVGGTECKDCPMGGYCPMGANAVKPCREGTFGNRTNLRNAGDCDQCPPGSACVSGASAPRQCSPGTVAPNASVAICDDCVAGKYQDESGAVDCKPCAIASFCPGEGLTSPIPCPGGTYSDQEGLAFEAQCVRVIAGYWAPTGSSLPIACDEAFYCPGYEHDDEYAGSMPIQVQPGKFAYTQNTTYNATSVKLELTLTDLSATSLAMVKPKLARLYQVPHSHITVNITVSRCPTCARRHRRRRSLQTTVEVLEVQFTPASSRDDDVHELLHHVIPNVTVEELMTALNATVEISKAAYLVEMLATSEEQAEEACPPGHWCTAGAKIPCGEDSYLKRGEPATSLDACKRCPANSVSDAGSHGIESCQCKGETSVPGQTLPLPGYCNPLWARTPDQPMERPTCFPHAWPPMSEQTTSAPPTIPNACRAPLGRSAKRRAPRLLICRSFKATTAYVPTLMRSDGAPTPRPITLRARRDGRSRGL